MKAFFSCVLAFALFVSVLGAGVFIPGNLSCGFKITYDIISTSASDGKTYKYNKWLSMYEKNYATYSYGKGDVGTMKTFSLVRADIHDPSDPKTAATFHYGHQGIDMCMFEGFNSYDNLFSDMDDDYQYFIKPFEYDSMNETDKWMGADCKSYYKETRDGEKTIIYAIDKNMVIGVYTEDEMGTMSYDIQQYEMVAYASSFTIESKYGGKDCKAYPKAYQKVDLELNCGIVDDLDDVAVSTQVSIFAIIFAVLISVITVFF